MYFPKIKVSELRNSIFQICLSKKHDSSECVKTVLFNSSITNTFVSAQSAIEIEKATINPLKYPSKPGVNTSTGQSDAKI